MLESAWLFVGVIATLMTVIALLTQTSAARHMGQADGIAIVTGALGTISWGVFAYGSLNVVTVGDSTTYTYSVPSLTLLAIAIAMISIYVTLTGPYEVLAARYENMDVDDY